MMEKYNLYRQGTPRFQTIATTTNSQQSTALTGSIINITIVCYAICFLTF
jgi:hypothetical protein